MLAEQIHDPYAVESPAAATVPGLGLLPTRVTFAREKHLGTPTGRWGGQNVTAYLIHHGVSERTDLGGEADVVPFLDGWQRGAVWGTTWHGAFENDGFRREFLTEVARRCGSTFEVSTHAPGFAARREAMIERLADAVEEHLDTGAVGDLLGL